MKPNFLKVYASSAEISEDRILLKNPYAHLDGNGQFSALKENKFDASQNEITTSRHILGNQYAHIGETGDLSAFSRKKDKYSQQEIENKVKALHKIIWKNRFTMWSEQPNFIDMLDPLKAFELIGYKCTTESTLGEFRDNGKVIEAAGLIDNDSRRIRISEQFKPEVRRFTAAHELGHALLHTQSGLHRDRPIDGTIKAKSPTEYEADFFASRFLMPENLLKTVFKKLFLTDKFILDENTASAFRIGSFDEVIYKFKSKRDLSRFLASIKQYNGVRFYSLAFQFKVSVEAMAIRLEELELFLF